MHISNIYGHIVNTFCEHKATFIPNNSRTRNHFSMQKVSTFLLPTITSQTYILVLYPGGEQNQLQKTEERGFKKTSQRSYSSTLYFNST